MATILEVSDGTTTVELNLAEGVSGFKLGGLEDAWMPTNPFYKNGGTWQSSPLADGRQLVDRRFENTIDTFAVHVESSTQDLLIVEVQDLKRLLEKAADYWASDWQDTAVYIKAKADNETNSRYAIIYTGRIIQDGNPYACRFNGAVGSTNIYWMWDLQLIIEHGMWSENAPGTGTAVEISAVESYNSVNFGNVDDSGVRDPTTAEEVYLAIRGNTANLSHIFIDDGGAWGGNLVGAAVPFSLLPAVPAVNDAIYFGIRTALANSGPFGSLVFDIGTGGAGYTGVWEYYDGAAGWSTLTVTDNTNGGTSPLENTGVNSVHWIQPATWATRALNLDGGPVVTGYFVRMRVTGIPGALTAPTQQNRNVYSIVWGYTEIQSTAVLGDIPAIAQIKLIDVSDKDGYGGAEPDLYQTRVVCGLRSISRGESFSAYLNCANEQNPTGVTVTYGANTIEISGISLPSGRGSLYSPIAAEALADRVIFTFTAALLNEFYGKFKVFLRGRHDTSANDVYVRLKSQVGSGGIITYSDTLTSSAITSGYAVFDLGTITIPGGKLRTTESGDQAKLVIQAGSASTLPDFGFADLILIPVDEWSADVELTVDNTDGYIQNGTYLLIDSIENPKTHIRSILFDDSDDAVAFYSTVSNGESILQANSRQRLWFFAMRSVYSGDVVIRYDSLFATAYKILVFRNQQYLSMRGNR